MNPEDINQTPETTTEIDPAEQTQVVEQAEQTQEASPAETKASDDAAFEQGFNAAQGIEEPAPTPAPTPEPEPEYTPGQVKELIETVNALKSREAKVFGTMGALKQQIDSLKSQPNPPPQAVKLAADGFKRLNAEFPELAKLLIEDLNEAMPTGTADNGQATQFVEQFKAQSEQLEAKSRKIEAQLLTVMHPDWKKVVATPEFATWKASLSEEARQQFDESWDAEYLAGQIAAHKDWKNKAVQQQQSKQRRLENAIAPRGNASTPPAPSDEEAFAQGFKSVRGTR